MHVVCDTYSVRLFQILWFCKIYTIDRAVPLSCPERYQLPRGANGRKAVARLYGILRKLRPLMDDMDMYVCHVCQQCVRVCVCARVRVCACVGV